MNNQMPPHIQVAKEKVKANLTAAYNANSVMQTLLDGVNAYVATLVEMYEQQIKMQSDTIKSLQSKLGETQNEHKIDEKSSERTSKP
jgi:hypothetical protein